MHDVLIVGAGPAGLSAAIALKQRGLSSLVVDKGALTESIRNFPRGMTFFSTPELIEIGDIPFTTVNTRPTREEALQYYRLVAEHYGVALRLRTEIVGVSGSAAAGFRARTAAGDHLQSRYLVLATGYYDWPNYIGVPGEDLLHVRHYYTEPFEYACSRVVVVGAANSAVEAALDLYRHGATVTLVHRGSAVNPHVNYWVRPDIENRIQSHEIEVCFGSTITRIEERRVHLRRVADGNESSIDTDFVLLLTGYHSDSSLIEQLGGELDRRTGAPIVRPETYESTVPGVFVIGAAACGRDVHYIFIENGRHHAVQAAEEIARRRRAAQSPTQSPERLP